MSFKITIIIESSDSDYDNSENLNIDNKTIYALPLPLLKRTKNLNDQWIKKKITNIQTNSYCKLFLNNDNNVTNIMAGNEPFISKPLNQLIVYLQNCFNILDSIQLMIIVNKNIDLWALVFIFSIQPTWEIKLFFII